MNTKYFLFMKNWFLSAAFLSVFVMVALTAPPAAWADHEGEIEQFVRARIDISESMADLFRKGGRPRFGQDGGPSMEEAVESINNHVSKILAKYDLSIDEYQSRKDEVFSDEAGVNDFLAAHPDLEKRYNALSQSPIRGRPRH